MPLSYNGGWCKCASVRPGTAISLQCWTRNSCLHSWSLTSTVAESRIEAAFGTVKRLLGLSYLWSLLPLSVPEVRRLLWQLFWQWLPSPTFILDWSDWRRRHQAIAQFYHYKRRLLNQPLTYLQL